MCQSCYAEYGSPTVDTPKTRQLSWVLGRMDPFGSLHIIVDDWNLEDDNIEFCRGFADKNERGYSAEVIADENHCLDLLESCTLEERASAMAMADGFMGQVPA